MTEADVYIHNFRAVCRDIHRRQGLERELYRLVLDCKRATDAGDTKRARTLLREADRISAQLER
jgi:hypothetical protein